MAKKLTFDSIPAAVEKILEILTDPDNGHEALPELLRRLAVVERKIDDLQKQVSPNRPAMDLQTTCRILKIRPKAAYELAEKGVLPSHSEGKKTLFYEDDVVKYFMNQPAWSAAIAVPTTEKPTSNSIPVAGRQPIGMDSACKIVERSAAAVYQLTAKNRIPFHRDGPKKLYFYEDELQQWLKENPPRRRREK